MVSAPFAGEIAKSLARPTKREIKPPLSSPKRVATNPGCRQFTVTPVPCRRRASSREENVAKLRATIGFHGTEAFRQLQIVEFQRSALMRGRCGIDDPSRCRGHEAFAQFLRHDKISHMIERERKFEPVLGKS